MSLSSGKKPCGKIPANGALIFYLRKDKNFYKNFLFFWIKCLCHQQKSLGGKFQPMAHKSCNKESSHLDVSACLEPN